MKMRKFLVILGVCVMLETSMASEPTCIQSHETILLSTLAVTTCLEVLPDQDEGVEIAKYIRQTVANVSYEVVELSYFEKPLLQVPILISDAGRNVTRPLPSLTEDDSNQEIFTLNYRILKPGDTVVRTYKIETLMTEMPMYEKKYTIGVGTKVSYRFLDESRKDALTQRYLEYKQHQQWPETVWFRNVRLQ